MVPAFQQAQEEIMDGAASVSAFETVTSYLSWDHDRLDALLEGVCRLVEARDLEGARDAYRAFQEGLSRHIRIEEELLFPLFEARTGLTAGPTVVMRAEHRDILEALGLMRDGLDRLDALEFEEGLRFLRDILPPHNAKEEHVLYPTTDRALSPAERTVFAKRLQAE